MARTKQIRRKKQDTTNTPDTTNGLRDGKACSVDEKTVGIKLYRNPMEGFRGTIKERYGDFIVREVTRQGTICQLTRLPRQKAAARGLGYVKTVLQSFLSKTHPAVQHVVKSVQVHIRDGKKQEQVLQRTQSINSICEDLKKTSQVDPVSLRAFLLNDDENQEHFLIPQENKKQRKMLHETIKQHVGAFISTDLFKSPEGHSNVRLCHSKNTRGNNKRARIDTRKEKWPANIPDYLNFTLYKTNQEMAGAVRLLKCKLHLTEGRIRFAGTKDKRAVTSQLCQLYRVKKEQLAGFNRTKVDLSQERLVIGDLTYSNIPIQLGDLQGNQFHVVIRNISTQDPTVEDDAVIERCVRGLTQDGFINYFGLQRFGTASIPTHEIGRALLQKNWALACDLILKPREGDPSIIAAAREAYASTKNITNALTMFPSFLIAENAVLRGFEKYGLEQCRKALDRIPRHLRMMYTHAYQSFVWNSAVSYRIETYGYSVAVGDLIVTSGVESLYHQVEDEGTAMEQPSKKTKLGDLSIRTITQEDIDAGSYSLKDIVLPLPGSNVQYPQNQVAEVYHKLVDKDGVDFATISGHSEFNLPGGYRPIIGLAKDFEYQAIRYDDVTLPLIPTDMDLMKDQATKEFGVANGKYRALCCKFTLSSSTYATMCLRELMKMSSNVQSQMQHNTV